MPEQLEKDPFGLDQHAPGAKLDANKPDMTLLMGFSNALQAVAIIGMYGMKKYTRSGWQYIEDGILRYLAACLRHIFTSDGTIDSDSKLPHLAHMAWNSLAALEMYLRDNPETLDAMKSTLRYHSTEAQSA